ncbi:MAG: MBL fold metallo-hydrolase [Dehalococcoidia bacterium]|nr:MBL fold metallo-hydrolase [Dehalococcoidia bacterium]
MKIIQVYLGGKEMVNAFIILGDRTIIVDTGNPGSTNKILKALDENRIARKSVSLILLTHAHRDHYGSVSQLREALDVPVAIHRADADYVRNGEIAPIIPRSLMGILALPFTSRGSIRPVDPDIVFDEELDLRQFKVEAKVISTPGHTNGSSSVIVERECIAGDSLMLRVPFRSIPALPLYAMDKASCLSSINRLKKMEVERVYGGHGGPWPMEEVRKRISQ